MTEWAGMAEEILGVQEVAENKNLTQIAAYVYNRACAYVGPNHEGVVVALFEAALKVVARRGK